MATGTNTFMNISGERRRGTDDLHHKLYTKMEDDDEGYYSEQLAESDSYETIMELWNDFQYWDYDKDDDCLALFKGEENLEEYYLTEKQKRSKAND